MMRKITVGLMIVMGLATGLWAGSLNPPAPPSAGTMKPLDEVEPRTPISSVPYTISQSGSYYLTKNLTAAGTAITISDDDVTLDLGGFTVTGPGSAYGGIYMDSRSNVEIRNGTIRGFYNGVIENSSTGKNHRVQGVRVMSCISRGISLAGKNCQIRDCIVSDIGVSAENAYIYGIYISAGGVIANCSITNTGNNATNNSKIYCIYTSSGSKISNNTVYNNGIALDGVLFGIYANNCDTITGNAIYSNGTSVTSSNVTGVYAITGCTITDNTVHSNGASVSDGTVYSIYAGSGCTIAGNTVYGNGISSTGASVYGILAGSGGSVIGNSVRSNGTSATGTVYGIYLGGYNLANNNTSYLNAGTGSWTNMYAPTTCVLGTNCAP